jgi:UDP-N-acetylglucosamine 4,6-dehydratase
LSSLQDATVTITGGTGSFGSTMTKYLLSKGVAQVRILSRDETKQDEMRRSFSHPDLRFFLGDVRDGESLRPALSGSDFVFHAAALKQVPSCEFFPQQAVQTNVLGSHNVIEESSRCGVRSVVCLSTDKAVYPINAMGMSKALMEKTAMAFARHNPETATTVAVTRYGNVMHSRGSVIPLFVEQIKARRPVTITDPSMTRFMMSLGESVDLVEHAFEHAVGGDLFVRKAPACRVDTLARAVGVVLGVDDVDVQVIGPRHGEKLHETLLTREERGKATDQGDYFRVPLDARSLAYELYLEEGERDVADSDDYTSANTRQLDVVETVALLRTLPQFAYS